MIILPAIDLLNGECVRLKKGVYATSEKVAENALRTAENFILAGAEWVHIVDLNGAKNGETINDGIVKDLAKTSLKVETGGGIRSLARAEELLNFGVERVIFGSVAVKNPGIIAEAVKEFEDKVAVSIDADAGYVKTDGWQQGSGLYYIDFAKQMHDIGVKTIIFTDIAKDGMLLGTNNEQLLNLKNAVSCDIIASGGVTDINDIIALKKMNLYGAICGKSLYAGTLNLQEAIKIAADLVDK